MRRHLAFIIGFVAATLLADSALALSRSLPEPDIFFPKGYNTNRAEQVHSVLRSGEFKYLGGLTSYWEPEWSTTLVYDGDSNTLTAFVAALNNIKGLAVRLTFSTDLSKETGSAPQAGSWWAVYSHTMPDTITVRINLAS